MDWAGDTIRRTFGDTNLCSVDDDDDAEGFTRCGECLMTGERSTGDCSPLSATALLSASLPIRLPMIRSISASESELSIPLTSDSIEIFMFSCSCEVLMPVSNRIQMRSVLVLRVPDPPSQKKPTPQWLHVRKAFVQIPGTVLS